MVAGFEEVRRSRPASRNRRRVKLCWGGSETRTSSERLVTLLLEGSDDNRLVCCPKEKLAKYRKSGNFRLNRRGSLA